MYWWSTGLLMALMVAVPAETQVIREQKIERRILQLVNQARVNEGLPALRWNERLGAAATAHLEKMVERGDLSHRFPGEPELTARVAFTGLRFNAAAENVAYASDWEDLHPGLMNSPGHRANILSTKYDEVGIAVAKGTRGYYAVQNFAHTTSETGTAEAESRWAKALRDELGRRLEVTFSRKIGEVACEMAESDRVDAKRLPVEPPRRRMFAYTSPEPDELPRGLIDAVRGANVQQIEVGICYRATEKYPGGTYWIGATY